MLEIPIALAVLFVILIYYAISNLWHRDKGNKPDDAS